MTVHVAGTAQVGGLIAQVGQRLLGATARMMMDRFFNCLLKQMQQPWLSGLGGSGTRDSIRRNLFRGPDPESQLYFSALPVARSIRKLPSHLPKADS